MKESNKDTVVLRACLGKRYIRPETWKQAKQNPGRALREWLTGTDHKILKQVRKELQGESAVWDRIVCQVNSQKMVPLSGDSFGEVP